MDFSPLVSIPLCTYNGSKYLTAQLDSLLTQTHHRLEILAFDDASTDRSVEILQSYARLDGRLKIHVNQFNMGFARNFQQALAACSGDYVAPCDQDDIWMPGKIARLIEVIRDRSLAYCDSMIVGESGEPLGCNMSDFVGMGDMYDPMGFVFDNCVSGHALLFKRELLPLVLPVPDVFFYDHWIAAVAAANHGVAFCSELLVHYRQHGGNVTNVLKERKDKQGRRSPGFRLKSWRRIGGQLQAISHLPGHHVAACVELATYWRLRETDWFSPRLCWLLFKNEKRLNVIHKRSTWAMVKDLKRRFVGIKVKRFFRPYPYIED